MRNLQLNSGVIKKNGVTYHKTTSRSIVYIFCFFIFYLLLIHFQCGLFSPSSFISENCRFVEVFHTLTGPIKNIQLSVATETNFSLLFGSFMCFGLSILLQKLLHEKFSEYIQTATRCTLQSSTYCVFNTISMGEWRSIFQNKHYKTPDVNGIVQVHLKNVTQMYYKRRTYIFCKL